MLASTSHPHALTLSTDTQLAGTSGVVMLIVNTGLAYRIDPAHVPHRASTASRLKVTKVSLLLTNYMFLNNI